MLALALSTQGLRKSDIFSTVHGYRTVFEAEGQTVALDRLFERDKAELRELGVPLVTLDDPAAPGDNQLLRYRIRTEQTAGASSLQLSDEEGALLSLAAATWRDGAMAGQSRRSLTKLRARGIELREDAAALAPRLRTGERAFEELTTAISAGATVRFGYLKPDAPQLEHRRVEPYALVRFDGHWLLAGYDLDRGEDRRFLLARIRGRVQRRGPVDPQRAAARLGRDLAAEQLAALGEHARSNPVQLLVAAGSEAELRLRRRAVAVEAGDEATLLTLHTADPQLLADELAGYGPQLRVLTPEQLRFAVAERWRRVLAEHRDAEETGR